MPEVKEEPSWGGREGAEGVRPHVAREQHCAQRPGNGNDANFHKKARVRLGAGKKCPGATKS